MNTDQWTWRQRHISTVSVEELNTAMWTTKFHVHGGIQENMTEGYCWHFLSVASTSQVHDSHITLGWQDYSITFIAE